MPQKNIFYRNSTNGYNAVTPFINSYRYAGLCTYNSPSSSCKAVIKGELYTRIMASSTEQPVSSITYFTNSLSA